jgi:hypothetical protein
MSTQERCKQHSMRGGDTYRCTKRENHRGGHFFDRTHDTIKDLTMCPAMLTWGDKSKAYCGLPIGHQGRHIHNASSFTLEWSESTPGFQLQSLEDPSLKVYAQGEQDMPKPEKKAKTITSHILDRGLAESTWRAQHPEAYDDLLRYREDIEISVRKDLERYDRE